MELTLQGTNSHKFWRWIPFYISFKFLHTQGSTQLGYCIAGNFWGRKLSLIGKKWPFSRENYETYHRWTAYPNFTEKTFAGGTKPQNSWVFSPSKVSAIGDVLYYWWSINSNNITKYLLHHTWLPDPSSLGLSVDCRGHISILMEFYDHFTQGLIIPCFLLLTWLGENSEIP